MRLIFTNKHELDIYKQTWAWYIQTNMSLIRTNKHTNNKLGIFAGVWHFWLKFSIFGVSLAFLAEVKHFWRKLGVLGIWAWVRHFGLAFFLPQFVMTPQKIHFLYRSLKISSLNLQVKNNGGPIQTCHLYVV